MISAHSRRLSEAVSASFGPALQVLNLEYAESVPPIRYRLLRRLGKPEPAGRRRVSENELHDGGDCDRKKCGSPIDSGSTSVDHSSDHSSPATSRTMRAIPAVKRAKRSYSILSGVSCPV